MQQPFRSQHERSFPSGGRVAMIDSEALPPSWGCPLTRLRMCVGLFCHGHLEKLNWNPIFSA
jgi:hypothetical protein